MTKMDENLDEAKIHHRIVSYLYVVFFLLLITNIFLWYSFYFAPHFEVSATLRLFDFDNEQNVPTIFNVLLLLLNSYVFYAIFTHEKKIKKPNGYKWALLSIIFLFMASDELFMLHERLVDPVKNYLDTTGALYFAWVIPMSVVVIIVALYFFRFYLSLSREIKIGIAIGMGLYLFGALGFEMVGGWWLTNFGDGFGYKMITTVEESLEMIGLIYLIKTLFLYEEIDKSNEQLLPKK